MSRLFTLLIILVLSVWFGLTVFKHPAFVFISYQPWLIQMPFWFAVLALLLIFGLVYVLLNSIERFQFWMYRIKNWLQFRREHKSYSKTQHGLALLVENRWAKAERLLLAGVKQSIDPLMNYLGAARAAQEQRAYDRRDDYLKTAYRIAPDADMAIGLTKAELDIEQGKYDEALVLLTQLRDKSSRHPRVLKLLERVYVHKGEWQQLLGLIKPLRKAKVLNQEQAEHFEKNVYCEMFHAASHLTNEELQKAWGQVPRNMRRNPDVVLAYSKQLLRFNNASVVEELARKALKTSWSAPLVKLYGALPFDNLNQQLVIVGTWLKTYGPQPELLLTLGKICARIKLWGKAKDYYEKCLALGPNPEASLAYARLLEEIGHEPEAVEKYREGLSAVTNT